VTAATTNHGDDIVYIRDKEGTYFSGPRKELPGALAVGAVQVTAEEFNRAKNPCSPGYRLGGGGACLKVDE
jgi:hypothetical protein